MNSTNNPKACFAEGGLLKPETYASDTQQALNERPANLQQSNAASNPLLAQSSAPPVAQTPMQGEVARQGIMADMNNLGKVAAQPGQGEGASYNWQTKNAAEQSIAAGINPMVPYRPGTANDPQSAMLVRKPQAILPDLTPAPQKKPAPQIQQVNPLASGLGFANGGKISGPGTPKSDSIPAKVRETGEPIKVSTDERIISIEQEAALQRIAEAMGFESVDAMLESLTGKPVGPTITADGTPGAADGMAPLNGDTIKQPARTPEIVGGLALGQSPAPTIHNNGGLPASVVQAGIDKMRGQLAQPAAANTEADQSKKSGSPMVIDGVRYGPAPTKTLNPMTALAAGYSAVAKQVLPVSDFDAKREANRAELDTTGKTNPAMATAKQSSPSQSVPSTVASPAAQQVQAEPVSINQQNPLTTKAILPGGYIDQGAGIISSRDKQGRLNISNVGTQGIADQSKSLYTDAQGNPTNDWSKTAQYAQGVETAQRMKTMANDMERARYVRDTQADIKDPRVIAAGAQGIARMDKEASAQQQAEGAGLDMQAKRDALAKNSMVNQMVAELSKAKTPEELSAKRANILAAQGRNPNEHRFFVGDDETTDAMGTKTKRAVLLDALAPGGRVGQQVASEAPSFQSKAELQAAIKAGKVKSGQTVMTPNGPMTVK